MGEFVVVGDGTPGRGSSGRRVRAPLTALPMSPKYLAIVLKPATGVVIGARRVTTKEFSTRRSQQKSADDGRI